MSHYERALSPELSARLAADEFIQIGRFKIVDLQTHRTFEFQIDRSEANNWHYSVYAYVSLSNGGKVIRVGKCEQRLSGRLKTYVYHVGLAVREKVGLNEQFKGSTPPWEREGWLHYMPSSETGLIFAQSVVPGPDERTTKELLRSRERHLINQYDPPLCNDSVAGRKLKADWIARYGKPTIRLKRDIR
jgi:hypothetical protein